MQSFQDHPESVIKSMEFVTFYLKNLAMQLINKSYRTHPNFLPEQLKYIHGNITESYSMDEPSKEVFVIIRFVESHNERICIYNKNIWYRVNKIMNNKGIEKTSDFQVKHNLSVSRMKFGGYAKFDKFLQVLCDQGVVKLPQDGYKLMMINYNPFNRVKSLS